MSAERETTCLYSTPAFRRTMGDALRPGGEELTLRGLALCGMEAMPGKPFRVLDAGCGTGVTLALLRRLGMDVTGLDMSPDMLAEARAKLGADAALLLGTADSLPLPDASMDGVVCECMLSLTTDPLAALGEMARVLKPGGKLLLTDLYVRQGEDGRADGVNCLAGASSLPSLRERLASAGFVLLAEEDHSRSLAVLAARMIFAGEEDVLRKSGYCGCGTSRRLGYVLMAAKKPEVEEKK